MSFLNGYIGLGTSISGSAIVEPTSGSSTGYARQPVQYAFGASSGQIISASGTFGPVSGTWGTLVVFGIFDTYGNPLWNGTLVQPLTPLYGQYVYTPAGLNNLGLGTQYAAFVGGAAVINSTVTNSSQQIFIINNNFSGTISSGTSMIVMSGVGAVSGVQLTLPSGSYGTTLRFVTNAVVSGLVFLAPATGITGVAGAIPSVMTPGSPFGLQLIGTEWYPA
jgi:hypothetical protein